MVTSVLIRTQVSRKVSFLLDSVSVRVPGVEILFIIYVQFREGVIHAPNQISGGLGKLDNASLLNCSTQKLATIGDTGDPIAHTYNNFAIIFHMCK